jgi:hypothetical protein
VPQQQQQTSKFPSLDLTFDLTKEIITSQLEQADTLDTKADSTQTAATTLIGAALVLEVVVLPLSNSLLIHILQIALLVPLLAIYMVVIINTGKAYRVRIYGKAPTPGVLIKNFLSCNEEDTKQEILKAMEEVFEENNIIINEKVKLIDKAILWRTIEALFLVLILFVQVVLVSFMYLFK